MHHCPSISQIQVHVPDVKAEDCAAEVQGRVEEYLGSALDSAHLEGVAYVRNVAPNKEMMRASFRYRVFP